MSSDKQADFACLAFLPEVCDVGLQRSEAHRSNVDVFHWDDIYVRVFIATVQR